jgi:tetratricopeptide (TPR) repeat protein
MKPTTAILISGVTAALISVITAASVTRASGAPAAPPAPEAYRPELERLRAEVKTLRSQMNALSKETPPAAPVPTGATAPAVPASAAAATKAALATGPTLDRVRQILRQGMAPDAVQKLFDDARAGRSADALVRTLEALVEENPLDAAAHCLLARGCIEALITEPDFVKKGDLARRADAEFVEALRLDPASWEANYSRASALIWWPEPLGKTPEAIQGFERALELQAGSASQPRYADTYAQLASLYTKLAMPDKAVALLAEGLRVFPGNEQLRKQLEVLQKR